jgi:hypothetical protein
LRGRRRYGNLGRCGCGGSGGGSDNRGLLRDGCWSRRRFGSSYGGRFLGFRSMEAVDLHSWRGRDLLFLRRRCRGLSDWGFDNISCWFLVNRGRRSRDRFRDRGRGRRGRFPWCLC